MEKRPLSLTIIAWIVILGAVFTLFSSFTMQNNPIAAKMLAESPLPASAHTAFSVAGAIAYLAAGYGILKGLPWSRWLYVGWSVLSLIFMLLTVPIISMIIMSVVILAVVAFFLFRPAANDWFNRTAIADA